MVTERYHPIWGGAENQLAQLSPHLVTGGCEVTILTRRYKKSWPMKEVKEGVRIVRLGWPGEGAAATFIFVLALLSHIFFNRKQIDILHSHGAVKMGSLCSVMARLIGLKNVTKIATAGKIEPLKRSFIGRVILHPFLASDKIIAMTDEIDNELMEVGVKNNQIARIPNGVDCNRFKPIPENERNTTKTRGNISNTGLITLFSGRLVHRKGLDVVIGSWSDIAKEALDIHLYILGSGTTQVDSVETDLRREVEQKQLTNVHFVGDSNEVASYLGCCDIFVFPSRIEGFPNALMEAMASGCAVVASDIGGVKPLIDHCRTGFIFEKDNMSDFSLKLIELANSHQLRNQLGKAARMKMVNNFAFTKVSEQYLNLYKELLGTDI